MSDRGRDEGEVTGGGAVRMRGVLEDVADELDGEVGEGERGGHGVYARESRVSRKKSVEDVADDEQQRHVEEEKEKTLTCVRYKYSQAWWPIRAVEWQPEGGVARCRFGITSRFDTLRPERKANTNPSRAKSFPSFFASTSAVNEASAAVWKACPILQDLPLRRACRSAGTGTWDNDMDTSQDMLPRTTCPLAWLLIVARRLRSSSTSVLIPPSGAGAAATVEAAEAAQADSPLADGAAVEEAAGAALMEDATGGEPLVTGCVAAATVGPADDTVPAVLYEDVQQKPNRRRSRLLT
ncbi:hypothetical protein NUW54_g12298 [Trametes sanguinea]|uniref:Uncharacterized protein n=1 Tax=Trametes sanguinea TaxID=158606 RepID=A0ACC1N1E0_9APHY|nr:hypothetical protein NUW54_g12298 [Trametes sanguinea]